MAQAELTRSDLMRMVNAIDLQRASSILEIFERPEIVQARADLEALIDPVEAASPDARNGNASANLHVLIVSALSPFWNVPDLARGHIAVLTPPPTLEEVPEEPEAPPPPEE